MSPLVHFARVAVLFALGLSAASASALDEKPGAPGEWGFRPADGSTVQVNPPAFTWRPQSNGKVYYIEVRGDDADAPPYHRRVNWNAHAMETPLAPGSYTWRFGAGDMAGTADVAEWSTWRSFTVSESARSVPPLPPLGELLARVPKQHPRLLLRPEGVPRLRELAQGRLAEQWKDLLAAADQVLKSPPDTSEPLLYDADMVRGQDAWRKRWWGNREHAIRVMGGASNLAFAYQITGDRRYGEAARDLLMAFCEWDPKGATNWRYNDEAAMPLVFHPARTYSWIHPLLSDAERKKVREVMQVRGNDCIEHLLRTQHLWKPYSSHSNRAWHKLGEAGIAFLDEIPEASTWLDFATTVFHTCYPVWGDLDGGWHEGTSYWQSYQGRFLYWVQASRAAFDIDPFAWPFYDNCGYYGLYNLPPGAKSGGFGDLAWRTESRSIAGLMHTFAVGAGNHYWQWYAEQHGAARLSGYMGFLLAAGSDGLVAKAPADLPSSRAFHGTGLAVLNSNLLDGRDNVQIHFKSSPFGRSSHGYNANNAFLLHLGGERVFIRSGARDSYGSDHHKNWMWETKSDNAILVNGKGQRPHTSDAVGRITAFDTSPTVDVVAGEAGDAYDNLDRWTRRIVFFKPNVVVIHDVLEAPEPSTFQWLLHGKDAKFEITPQSATWKGKPGRVEVQFLTPEGLDITQTDKFDPPVAEWSSYKLEEWHLTATLQAKRAQQEFVTLLRIDGAKVDTTLAGDGKTLSLRLPGGEDASIKFTDKGFTVTTGDYKGHFEDNR